MYTFVPHVNSYVGTYPRLLLDRAQFVGKESCVFGGSIERVHSSQLSIGSQSAALSRESWMLRSLLALFASLREDGFWLRPQAVLSSLRLAVSARDRIG